MHALDLRDRFKCLSKRDGLNKTIKSVFNIKSVSNSKDKSLKFDILVSGGIKEEGQFFEYRLADNADQALNDFLYYDLFSYLSKKEGHLIWRVEPQVEKLEDGNFKIYSRLVVIN